MHVRHFTSRLLFVLFISCYSMISFSSEVTTYTGCPNTGSSNCGHAISDNSTSVLDTDNIGNIVIQSVDNEISAFDIDNINKISIGNINSISITNSSATGQNINTFNLKNLAGPTNHSIGNIGTTQVQLSNGTSTNHIFTHINIDNVDQLSIGRSQDISITSDDAAKILIFKIQGLVNAIVGDLQDVTVNNESSNSESIFFRSLSDQDDVLNTFGNFGDITINSGDDDYVKVFSLRSFYRNTFGNFGDIAINSGEDTYNLIFDTNNDFKKNTFGNFGDISVISDGSDSYQKFMSLYGRKNNFGDINSLRFSAQDDAYVIVYDIMADLNTFGSVGSITIDALNDATLDVYEATGEGNRFGNVGPITITTGNDSTVHGYQLRWFNKNTFGTIDSISIGLGDDSEVFAIELENSDENIFGTIGNIDIESSSSHVRAIKLKSSRKNTFSSVGDITTSGNNTNILYLRKSSKNNFGDFGSIDVTSYDDNVDVIELVKSNNNTFGNFGNITVLAENADNDYSVDVLDLENSNNNVFGNFGNAIVTSGIGTDFIELDDSDNNTFGNFGNITTTSISINDDYSDPVELENSDNNIFGNFGNLTAISNGDGTAEPLELDDSDDNTFGNFGNITAISNGGEVIGLDIYDGASNNKLGNFGSVQVSTASDIYSEVALGISLDDDTNNNSFGNFGNIDVSNTTGENASGIYIYDDAINNSFGNFADINVVAKRGGDSDGIEVRDDSHGNTFGNFGNIRSVTNSDGQAKSVNIDDSDDLVFGNFGNLESIAKSTGDAIGIQIDDSNDLVFGNFGNIRAQTAGDAVAFAIDLDGADDSEFGDFGDLTAIAGADGSAYAIYVGNANGNILGEIGHLNVQVGNDGISQGAVFNSSDNNIINSIKSITSTTSNMLMDTSSDILSNTATSTLIDQVHHGFVFAESDNNLIGSVGNITVSSNAIPLAMYDSIGNQITLNGAAKGNNNVNGTNTAIVLDMTSDQNVITLGPGALIVGAIVDETAAGTKSASDQNILRLDMGAGASYDFNAIQGDWKIEEMNERPMILGSAHAVGVANVMLADQNLTRRADSITQNFVMRNQAHHNKHASKLWANTYAAFSKRNEGNLAADKIDHTFDQAGISMGIKLDASLPMELVVNIENSELELDGNAQTIDTNSIVIGALFPELHRSHIGTFSAHAMVGYSDNETERRIMSNTQSTGYYDLDSDFNSFYLLTGAQLSHYRAAHNVAYNNYFGIDINAEFIESYNERDFVSWESRDLIVAQPYAGLNIQYNPNSADITYLSDMKVSFTEIIGGRRQNYSVLDNDVSIKSSDDASIYAEMKLGVLYTPSAESSLESYLQLSRSDEDLNTFSLGMNFNVNF